MSLVIDKALHLVELVADGNHLLAELVSKSELSRSTTHRLLVTLVKHGYLSYVDRNYEIGFRFLELGEKKRNSLKFINLIRPELERCAQTLGDTVHLAIMDGVDIVIVDCISGNRELQIRSYIGQRAPAFRTAVGKALISHQPVSTWDDYLKWVPDDYVRKPQNLREDLEVARRRGYAVDFDEVSIGTCGIASAFSISEARKAAVSVNGATVYFPQTRINELGKIIVQMGNKLSEILRFSGVRG